MKNILTGITLLALSGLVNAAPVTYTIYTDEAKYILALETFGYIATLEGFENDTVWADSRTPGSTSPVTSKGVMWTSNFLTENGNEISTGSVGGDVPEKLYAIFSNPHGIIDDSAGINCQVEDPIPIPPLCFQNDGLKVAGANGETLYGFGGRFDTSDDTRGKVTFLLDGIDIFNNGTDNRDGVSVVRDISPDIWGFIGVIDTAGFNTAEVRELSGKDEQQNNLFADDFTIASTETLVPAPAAAWLFGSGLLALTGIARRRIR